MHKMISLLQRHRKKTASLESMN